jgi:carbon monoxide dehydrogenase subunit G
MRLEKTFDLNERREVVWDARRDIRLVAECLPGTTIIDELGSLDLGRLIWTILQKRVLAFMARLFGR